MFNRILVPVDGTLGSERAVPYAVALAQSLDCKAIVCHVLAAPITANTATQQRKAVRYVGEIASRFRSAGVTVMTQVRRGDPLFELSKAAVEWNVDAIVMATRSRRRVEKLVLGSVADAVVRDSHLPVLLVTTRGAARKVVAEAERTADRSNRVQAAAMARMLQRLDDARPL